MIPNKMEMVRQVYSDRTRELLADLAERLKNSPLPIPIYGWECVMPLPKDLTGDDLLHIRMELTNAGWSALTRYDHSRPGHEELVVYINTCI